MKAMLKCVPFVVAVLVACVLFKSAHGAPASVSSAGFPDDRPQRVEGEFAKSDPAFEKLIRQKRIPAGTIEMRQAAPMLDFGAVEDQAIDAVKKSNGAPNKSALQIGITRESTDQTASFQKRASTLAWKTLASGAQVAHMRVRSADAKSLRVAIDIDNLPSGVEARFFGERDWSEASAHATAKELVTLKDAANRYWSPVTEGDTQTIELFAPAGADTDDIVFNVKAVSHIFGSAGSKFSDSKATSDCTLDVACAPQTPALVKLKSAVTLMVYQGACGPNGALATCTCTGTLSADFDQSTQIPFVLTADRCLIHNAEVANTLNSYWFFENATCNTPRTTDVTKDKFTRLSGGAEVLFTSSFTTGFRQTTAGWPVAVPVSDPGKGTLLRLKEPAPAGAYFAGWDLTSFSFDPLSRSSVNELPVVTIFHSNDEPKRFAAGVLKLSDSVTLSYTKGTSLGRALGAGVFSQQGTNYYISGVIESSAATCDTASPGAPKDEILLLRGIRSNAIESLYYTVIGAPSNFYPSSTTIKPFDYKTTDMWWNPVESGWGLQVVGNGNAISFATWYTYDEAGNQLFLTLQNCGANFDNPFAPATSTTTCNIYRTTGASATQIPVTPPIQGGLSIVASTTIIGTATIRFTTNASAIFRYKIGDTIITKDVERFAFGSKFADYGKDYTNVYYDAEYPGWGLTLTQQGDSGFAVIYHYDDNGKPMFLTAAGPIVDGKMNAEFLRTKSNGKSHYLSATWDPRDISSYPASKGKVDSVVVAPGFNGTIFYPYGIDLTFSVNGYTQKRKLARLFQ